MKFPWRSRSQRGEELDEEIRAHLQMAIADRVARAESRADAERAARREFGNVAHVTEVTRDMWGGLWLERLGRDLRYAARGLRRAPGFTAVALLTLALGIGANTAIFTVVNGVLLRPLPFPHAERLFLVSHRPTSGPFEMPPSLDEATYLTFHRQTRAFERVATFTASQFALTGAGDAVRLHGASVTADFMTVLGVNAALGRSFVVGEDTPGRNRVAILGDELWHSAFAGDSAIVGRRIILDGVPHTVIGVMPPRFAFPYDAQVWTPLLVATDPHNSYSRPVVGRLRSGVGPNDARLELERIVAGRHLPNDKAVSQVLPLKELLTAKVEKSLLVFAGAVAFVLLIACANVANLLLIRAATRRHELGVRAALGATRATLLRLMLSESALVVLRREVSAIEERDPHRTEVVGACHHLVGEAAAGRRGAPIDLKIAGDQLRRERRPVHGADGLCPGNARQPIERGRVESTSALGRGVRGVRQIHDHRRAAGGLEPRLDGANPRKAPC